MADNPQPSAAIKRLEALVGTWDIVISFRMDPPVIVPGRSVFEWMDGGFFLVEHAEADRADFPKQLAIMGGDVQDESYPMHSFDSRGIYRTYQMSLKDGVWKMWRDDPEFSQRFTGTFSADGRTIIGTFEASTDGGKTWNIDFDTTYTKRA